MQSNIATAEDRGEKRGIQIGEQRGIEIGDKRGEQRKALVIASNMLKRNRPIDEIIEDTGLTREEVEKLDV
jgi:predicted transposase/invertase (TIGR01784 family)